MRDSVLSGLIIAAVIVGDLASAQQSEGDKDAALASLRSNDADERLSGLRDLMTSLDPRIPDALLPLLRDQGNSVRRLAARGIGSRWWQIAPARRGHFIAALKNSLSGELDNEKSMARRAIALLSGDYRRYEEVYPSPNGRWVAYERLQLPCVIDTTTQTEELVGWDAEPAGADGTLWFAPAWGGGNEVRSSTLWHPRSSMVAFDMQTRRSSNVWVWRPGGRLRRLETDEICAKLPHPDGEINEVYCGIGISATAWRGKDLILDVTYTVGFDNPAEKSASLAWNADTDELRLLGKP